MSSTNSQAGKGTAPAKPARSTRRAPADLTQLLATAPAERAPLTGATTSAHTSGVARDASMAAADDILKLDPRKITRRGPFVRTLVKDAEYERFRTTVQIAGTIYQPILVRQVGTAAKPVYDLVDGMRRLATAEDLAFPLLDARDLGPIDDTESLQIQVMLNEARAATHAIDLARLVARQVDQEGLKPATIRAIIGKRDATVFVFLKVGRLLVPMTAEEHERAHACPWLGFNLLRKMAAAHKQDALDPARFTADVMAIVAEWEQAGRPEEESGAADGAGEPAERPAPDPAAVARPRGRADRRKQPLGTFEGQPNKWGNGWRFEAAWTFKQIRENPDAFVQRAREMAQKLIDQAEQDANQARLRNARSRRYAHLTPVLPEGMGVPAVRPQGVSTTASPSTVVPDASSAEVAHDGQG